MKMPGEMDKEYSVFVHDVAALIESARRAAAKSINNIMTATYWFIGRRIVEQEQSGNVRAQYGEGLLARLAQDLSSRFGRGFSPDNLETMRMFYRAFPPGKISETLSRKLRNASGAARRKKSETLSRKFDLEDISAALPLSWSHYVRLVRSARSPEALDFYHAEALRGGWNVRQLDRQINSQFYERTALSRDKKKLLRAGQVPKKGDDITPDEEIKDPLVLEFLGLKDEYSETQMEEAIIRKLEAFLLEMGNDFAFVGRQRRLRIDDEWFRVDLLLFHRRLRCLVIIDLKLGRFSHADAGQMHLYLNYAREHWTQPEENPPVGIILCSAKGDSLVRYSTEGLPNKTLVREYLHVLPDERILTREIKKTRSLLEGKTRPVKRRKS
jgi:predicted nuclease of restriction endonuclease-like (RecB) superfamily